VHYVQADIGDARQRGHVVGSVTSALGTPSALVNNAGRGPRVRADLLDASEESFEELVRTNLQGPYFLTQAVANAMLADRSAARRGIIFITSVSAEMASVQRGEYCVSKAGLSMAAKLFAVRLAPEGIPVFEVRPGIITSDMTAGVKEKYDQRIADGLIPDARWGTPEDVGAAVTLLLREDVRYATGSVLHVDGGLAIPRL
jgi:NAD(P)-dependent dehydrogenase (short-subunit alcohol dehydrogenase family)